MITGQYMDRLDRTARHIRQVDKPFGGIQVSTISVKLSPVSHFTQVIGVGDFLQLPPVPYPKENLAFESRCWKDLFPSVICLSTVHRQVDQGTYPRLSYVFSSQLQNLYRLSISAARAVWTILG
jgi:hypothetical protein